MLARRLNPASFTDVTCSGATTDDVDDRSQQTRFGEVPRQIDAVTHDTDLITVTIGGNDVDLSALAMGCRVESLDAQPCVDRLVTGGVDRISQAIDRHADDWSALVDALQDRAPDARIIVVGYATYIRPGGCYPEQPAHPRDADYFQAKVDELNAAQQRLAADKRVEYFDVRALSVGHDMCAPPDQRYIEGYVLANKAAPLHPNATGTAAVGNALADYYAG